MKIIEFNLMKTYRRHFFCSYVVLLLICLFLTEGVSIFLTYSETAITPSVPLRISEIDGPRIDDMAAAIDREAAESVPSEIWLFLIFAYMTLLIFNFSYTFEKVKSPQWFWEVVYTLLAFLCWIVLDPLGKVWWFPLMIAKGGLILFILYIYLVEKKLAADDKPQTEPSSEF